MTEIHRCGPWELRLYGNPDGRGSIEIWRRLVGDGPLENYTVRWSRWRFWYGRTDRPLNKALRRYVKLCVREVTRRTCPLYFFTEQERIEYGVEA